MGAEGQPPGKRIKLTHRGADGVIMHRRTRRLRAVRWPDIRGSVGSEPSTFPIVFLIGPSGVGKSDLACHVASELHFLPLELDLPDGRDGIDMEGLRAEWNLYWEGSDPDPLASALQHRIGESHCAGSILSFSSLAVPSQEQLTAARQAGISFVLMYGSGADCLRSFLEREHQLNRGLDEDHWVRHNACSYALFSSPRFDRYRLEAFAGGKHRERAELVKEIAHRVC